MKYWFDGKSEVSFFRGSFGCYISGKPEKWTKAQISLYVLKIFPQRDLLDIQNKSEIGQSWFGLTTSVHGTQCKSVTSLTLSTSFKWSFIFTYNKDGSNEYPQFMFWAEMWKISEYLSENFHFLLVKFSVYFNRLVLVMLRTQKRVRISHGKRHQCSSHWGFTVCAFYYLLEASLKGNNALCIQYSLILISLSRGWTYSKCKDICWKMINFQR